ncbi:MAG: class II fructose-bisphosphatase [Alteraurantiacibacter sp.]
MNDALAPALEAEADDSAITAALDRGLAMELVRVTEAAASAAAKLVGRGDETAADEAAVRAMRDAFNLLAIDGTVVIGEGERDNAPMLFIGEKLGAQTGAHGGLALDIAVDPLEGTTIAAKAGANALAVLAVAGKGCLLNAPDIYMEKIAIGPGYPAGLVSLARTAEENIAAVAKAKGVAPAALMVCVLDRPRHAELIATLRAIGCGIQLIPDGDIAGVIAVTDPDTGVDLYMGSGGAPEGVLAAAALRTTGGQFEGRLMFRHDGDRRRAHECGITDFERIYGLEDLARGDCIFAATGVTDGPLLDGVRTRRRQDGSMIQSTHSVVMRASSGTIRWVHAEHCVG